MLRKFRSLLVLATPKRHRWVVTRLLTESVRELPYLLRGRTSLDHALYGEPTADYLTERDRETNTGKINGAGAVFLNDKLAFHLLLAERPSLLPEFLGLVVRGQTSRPNGAACSLSDLVQEASGVVVRPTTGALGRGIFFIEADGRDAFVLNKNAVSKDQVDDLEARLPYHIVTRLVAQHPYAASIYPDAVNTIRLLMMRDPRNDDPFLAGACHRFGTERSSGVDNFAAGGLSTSVDLHTGRLGRATALPDPGRLPTWFSSHPDTGAPIEAVAIPGWAAILECVERAMAIMPMVRYVGWDVVQTERGPKIIEGNSLPDARVLQVHGGLLRDERVRRFYEYHGVIAEVRS